MGSLKDLTDLSTSVHLLQTNSNLAEIYVYDTLKGVCKASTESIITVDNKSAFAEMLDFINVEPFLADKWLFVIQYKKIKSQIKKFKGLFQSASSRFLIKVESYKDFLEFKELKVPCNDIYLSAIRESDIVYLLQDYPLSQKMVSFVAKTYRQDVDKVFELKQALDSGLKIETTKDIVKICGESASSSVRLVMLMLNELPSTDRGVKMVFSKRIKALSELLSSFGPRSTYNFLVSSVADILDLKVLYLSGTIYDAVRGIPEAYNEKRLSRYNYYLKRITTELPYERILRLYSELKQCNTWRTDDDAIQFVYQYYLNSMKAEA